jgi:predicted nuclease with RNAse H fold
MLFLGYDPGGKGTHGVAAIQVSQSGELIGRPVCEIAQDAGAAWNWLRQREGACALGIDTLLAWSPCGGRACDDALRRKYRNHAPTVIAQNALYSSMTLNGAMVARRAERHGLPVFESHPKLLTRVLPNEGSASQSVLAAYRTIKDLAGAAPAAAKRADDMADAVVAAWCAAQGFLGRWTVNLFDLPGDALDLVTSSARYPWPEPV